MTRQTISSDLGVFVMVIANCPVGALADSYANGLRHRVDGDAAAVDLPGRAVDTMASTTGFTISSSTVI